MYMVMETSISSGPWWSVTHCENGGPSCHTTSQGCGGHWLLACICRNQRKRHYARTDQSNLADAEGRTVKQKRFASHCHFVDH